MFSPSWGHVVSFLESIYHKEVFKFISSIFFMDYVSNTEKTHLQTQYVSDFLLC